MPLGFLSRSHGTVAFGFFHIESHMLLLEQQFFFADRFCRAVVDLAEATGDCVHATIGGWGIDSPAAVGDLGGAIRGTNLTGFIGSLYERMPFPKDPRDFKQSPDEALEQDVVTAEIEDHGGPRDIGVAWDRLEHTLTFGGVAFSEAQFAALVAYVDRGGYPRWRDEIRPAYVAAMVARLRDLGSPLFDPQPLE